MVKPPWAHKLTMLVAATALFITVLAPPLYLSVFTRPRADDFIIASVASRHDMLYTIKDWYTRWTGRYFSFFLFSFLNPMTYDSARLYPVVIAGMILLQWCSSFLVLKKLTAGFLDTPGLLLTWALLNSFYYGFVPGLSDGVYWLAGSFVYQSSIILLPLWLLVLFRPETLTAKKGWRFVYALTGGAILIGCNELVLVTVVIVSFLDFAWKSLDARKVRTDLLLLFVLLLGFAIVEVAAPGNYARASTITHKPGFFTALYSSFTTGNMYAHLILFHTPFLIISLLLPRGFYQSIITRLFPATNRFIPDGNKWVNLVLPLSAWGIYISSFLPVKLSGVENDYWLTRNLNYSYFLFLIAWTLSLAWTLQFFDLSRLRPSGKTFAWFRIALLVVLAFGLYISEGNNNLKVVYKDIGTGMASRYGKTMDARFEFLDSKRNSAEVVIDSLKFGPLINPPYLIPYVGDRYPQNIDAYREFYKIGAIHLK